MADQNTVAAELRRLQGQGRDPAAVRVVRTSEATVEDYLAADRGQVTFLDDEDDQKHDHEENA